ncbi:membrane protein [Alishewanella longhuensis]|uniref:Membrane protein n=1 Tax=Alishewanella longhuensis TaxID=1091037 RepID=A0ABQ3KV89_9ALTE|nr:MipA/OmpV family protein [Alishewanella longhuensis]GHG58893.1 membrane protein [Alishewanella longhuensis]
MKQIGVITLLAIQLGLFASLPTAQAAEFELGVAAVNYGSPYKGIASENLMLPWISYRGERFSLNGLDISYQLYQRDNLNFSFKLAPAASYLDPNKSRDLAISKLDKRQFTALAGAELKYQLNAYFLKANLLRDITGKHNGIASSATVGRPFHTAGIIVIPEIGLHYWDSKISNYYYGVSSAESERSGLTEFQSSAKFRVQSGLTVIKQLSPNNKIFFNTSFGRFIGAYDSPVLNKNTMYTGLVGWSYTF